MAFDIRLPNINGNTEAEQLQQIKRYLYQLAEELKYNLNTLEAGTSDEASIEKVGIIDSLNKWKLGIAGEIGSIAAIRQSVSSQGASIKALSEWKKDAANSISKIDQITDADFASITGLAQYKTSTTNSISSITQRVTAAEVTIETLTKINEGDTESLAGIVSKVAANESNILSLTEWKNGTNQSIARIDELVKANQASIGLVVDNGAVKGNIVIEAINKESAAKIAADRLDIVGKTLDIKVNATNITGTLTASQINATNLKVSATNVTGKLTAEQIDATNLKVKAANIDGTLTAEQIKVDDLSALGATIGGFTVDHNSIHSGMRTSSRILLCSGTSASYRVNGFTSTGWSILAGDKFGVLKNGTMYAEDAVISGTVTTGATADEKEFGVKVGDGFIHINSTAFYDIPTDSGQVYLLLKFDTEDGHTWGLFAMGPYGGENGEIELDTLFVERIDRVGKRKE